MLTRTAGYISPRFYGFTVGFWYFHIFKILQQGIFTSGDLLFSDFRQILLHLKDILL